MSGSLAKLAAAIESQLTGKRMGMAPEPLLRFSHLQAASHELYQRYERAEQAARARRLGLWRGKDPTPPWDWRRERREHSAAKRQGQAVSGTEKTIHSG